MKNTWNTPTFRVKSFEAMEPPRAGRPGRPFGVSKPSDCKVLVVSSWSEPAGDRAAIMASEGESLPSPCIMRCPIITKNNTPNQIRNITYLKLIIFQETQQESRSQNRWIKTPTARYAHPSARIPAVFELPLNESSNLGRKTTNSETPQKTCRIVVIWTAT